ncbi:MAG: TolC family protein [bacterium]|nr:TolC family protein [bacterium]
MTTRRIPLLLMLAVWSVAGGGGAEEVLTFDEAWHLVRDRHPALTAAAADLEAREADLDQAGRLPNPELEFEIENFAGSGEFGGFEATDMTLALSQTWERGGKAAGRQAVAAGEIAVSRAAGGMARQELRADLARAFIQVLASQRRVDLADSLAHLAEEDRIAVDRRVAAGAESRISAQRARLEAAGARRGRDRTRQEWQAARERLGALWGDDLAGFARVAGDFDAIVPVPDWPELLAGLESSPSARLRAAETERARAATGLARSLGAVDLTTSAGVRHFRGPGDNAFMISVGVPLAVRDNGSDARRAAAADLARSEAESRASLVDLKAAANEARTRLATSQADVLAMRRNLLPAAATALAEARSAYARGAYSLTDLLSLHRTWTEWQLAHVDALTRHHLAAIDLAVLLGEPAGVPARTTEETP